MPLIGTAEPKPQRLTAAERRAKRRDRHGWRTAKKRNKFGDPTRAKEQADARRHEVAVKAETRRKVWQRSAVCEYCGDPESITATKSHRAEHEQDEVIPRSLTRGLAPEIRFASANTARACTPCHARKTRKQIRVELLSALGMDGDYNVKTREGAVILEVRR